MTDLKSFWLRKAMVLPALMLMLGVTGTAHALALLGPADVNVVNKPTVTIGNTAATPVPVTGSVTINNPAPVTGAVTVNNTASAPVPVRMLDDSLRDVVQGFVTLAIAPGAQFADAALYTVPAGKRLVIEFVSANSPPKSVMQLSTTPNPSADGLWHYIAFTQLDADTSRATEQVRLYANGGTTLIVRVLLSPSSSSRQAIFTFSGYLVDLP